MQIVRRFFIGHMLGLSTFDFCFSSRLQIKPQSIDLSNFRKRSPLRCKEYSTVDPHSDKNNFPPPRSLSTELDLLSEDEQIEEAKELIVNLRRRGEGWGEEILPKVTIEWRPIKKTNPNLQPQQPYTWKEASLEEKLWKAGVPKEEVEKVAAAAAAWRVTPKGRPLIDRRRRNRLERNAGAVISHLVEECGVQPGADGVGLILMKTPQILLVNVGTADRWNKRIVELSVFSHIHGHCNVPEDWPISPALGKWVQRIQSSWQNGELTEERVQLLFAVGFEFEQTINYITRQWESEFDAFIEWIFWNKERGLTINWSCLDWVRVGGWRAGKVANWTIYQRELWKRGLLPSEAIQRLEAFEFEWKIDSLVDSKMARWLDHLGKLVFTIESHKAKLKRNKSYLLNKISMPDESGLFLDDDVDSGQEKRPRRMESSCFADWEDWESSSKALERLDSMEDVEFDGEVKFWLEKQRALWRVGNLPFEKLSLIYSSGLDLNVYNLKDWHTLAQSTSHYLLNFDIRHLIEKQNFEAHKEQDFVLNHGPHMLVKPQDIVSISDTGSIIEQMEWKTFQSLNAHQATEGGSVITIEPTIVEASVLTTELNSLQPSTNGSQMKDERLLGEKLGWSVSEMRRWLLTQQALWKERRLSKAQLQYLAILGLTWLLSFELIEMSEDLWSRFFAKVQIQGPWDLTSSDLNDFLVTQRALHRVRLLPRERVERLESIGFDWNFSNKSEEEIEWDLKISEMIKFRRRNGHCRVNPNSDLGQWLRQTTQQSSTLSKIKTLQLRALKASFK